MSVMRMQEIAAQHTRENQPLHFPASLLEETQSIPAATDDGADWREVVREQKFLLGRQARRVDELEDQLQFARKSLQECERRLNTLLQTPGLKTLFELRGKFLSRRK